MTIRYAVTAGGNLPKPDDWKDYDDIDAMISEDRRGRPLREAIAKVLGEKDAAP